MKLKQQHIAGSSWRWLPKALLTLAIALLPATSAFAACRLSDFTSRSLSSLSEIERLSVVTQMTRTEFAKFHALGLNDPNYYALIAASANALQAKQRAQAAIAALGMEQGAEYAKFWASNLLDDKTLKEYTLCVAQQQVGVWMRGRMARPGVVNMVFAHTRPVGVGPYPIVVTGSQNIRNIAQLTALLQQLGPRDQFFGETFSLQVADRSKPASLTMKFGEETPRTLQIPAFPAPRVAPFANLAGASQGASFRDCADGCPEMISVPSGSFTMGASLEEDRRAGVPPQQSGMSTPLHRVNIPGGYALGKYEVTIEEFRAFVKATGYQPANYCTINRKVNGTWVYESRDGFNWNNPSFDYKPREPVVCVTWEDAKAYTDWMSRKTGVAYSLPTEAIYEYAARAGTTTAYFWGDDLGRTEGCKYSNQTDASQDRYLATGASSTLYRFACDDGYPLQSPAGTFLPNPWGFYDILGNVWEWTEDCWNKNYDGAPADGSARSDGDCDERVMRGGSSGNTPPYSRSGNRAVFLADYSGHSLGFRVMSKR